MPCVHQLADSPPLSRGLQQLLLLPPLHSSQQLLHKLRSGGVHDAQRPAYKSTGDLLPAGMAGQAAAGHRGGGGALLVKAWACVPQSSAQHSGCRATRLSTVSPGMESSNSC